MKLLLADDHTLFRDALVQYISRSDIKAEISVAKDLNEVIDILEQDSKQDLIILDLRMPGMHGLNGFKLIREKYAEIPTALMSGVAEEEDVKESFELGAVGYFPKTMSGKALLQAIKLVLTGERFMPLDHSSNKVMPSYYDDGDYKKSKNVFGYGMASNSQDMASYKLTPREREVLGYLAQGASNKEIANDLGLQVVTVKLHVRGICRKLDVKNRTQAALKAGEMGAVAPAERAH
ncbi:MAG: DNA-binding response regulator [Micavibrio sp.]|nr:DNA-binding response regulator [Micavibrio sp.]